MSSLTLTLIQSDLHWENKPANLKVFEEKINSIKEKTEVIILPEMFSTGFTMHPEKFAEDMTGETVTWMKRIAAKKRAILTGSIIIKEKDNYYNRLLWILPTGESGYYDKRHLFAYAGENERYKAGSKRLIASVKGWKLNLMVCYDLRFPVWARQQLQILPTNNGEDKELKPEYDILMYLANWPEKRIHAWNTLLQARAIENQCYVIGVNRIGNDGNAIYHNGNSMVVNAMGEVLYQKQHQEDIFTITLEKQHLADTRSTLPFLKDADEFQIIND